jgi:hypothetical protein
MVKMATTDDKVFCPITQPYPPKKPLSAFFLYKREVFDRVRSQNPDAKIADMVKIISGMWAQIDEATKTRLEA